MKTLTGASERDLDKHTWQITPFGPFICRQVIGLHFCGMPTRDIVAVTTKDIKLVTYTCSTMQLPWIQQ